MIRSILLPVIVTIALAPAAIVSATGPDPTPTTSAPATDVVEEPAPSTSVAATPETAPETTTTTSVAPDATSTTTTISAETTTTTTVDSTSPVTTVPESTVATTTDVPQDPYPTDPADTPPEAPAPVLPDTVSETESAQRDMFVTPDLVDYILATIRYLESRSRYDAPPNRGNASGAYQYIRSTWNNYGGYEAAYLAPPALQDQRARGDVLNILARWNNDVSMVPVIWYFPAAASNPTLMDIVPMPHAGNVLTVRQYQTRWLETFAFITGQPLPARPVPAGLDLQAGLPPLLPEPADPASVEIAYPLLGPSVVAPPPPCVGEDCPSARPAIINGHQLQPVLAVVNGVVTAIDRVDALSGEVRLTITDARGRSYHYSGFNDDTPGTSDGAAHDALRLTGLGVVGATVRAGQIIGFLGDTDASWVLGDQLAAAPRLRLWITDVDGTLLDADGAVQRAIARQTCGVGLGPWSSQANPATVETPLEAVAVDAGANAGQWRVDASGRVTAVGAAALIYPTNGCTWAPSDPFGADAGGSIAVPTAFEEPIDLPTPVWVAATVAADAFRPVLLLRPG